MPGYVIATTEVTDPLAFAAYLDAVGPIVERHGGRFVAAGRSINALEGDRSPNAAAVIEFDTVDDAKRWYHSAEYRAARQARHRSGRSTVILLDTNADS